MRCYYHPEEEAVAICKSCGRGACQQCTVLVGGDCYCKTCVETGRAVGIAQIPPQPLPTPTPAGVPSKTPFVVGSVGAIISGVAAVLSIFGGIGALWLFNYYYYYGTPSFGLISGVLLAVGLILAGLGYKGMKTNYGLGIGTAGFAFSVVSCVFLLIEAALILTATYSYSYYYYYSYSPWYVVYIIFAIIALEIFAVTQILWGVAHIKSRIFTGNSALGLATGIVLIISGAFTASLLLAFVGMIMFLVSQVLSMVVFLISRIPK